MMETNQEIVSKVLAIFPSLKNILTSKNVDLEEKDGVGNFVTSIDKKIEEYIKNSLLEIFPTAQIIGEETADEIKVTLDSGLKFVVDPLDGTTNFTNNWPHTVSIGVINNNELIAGIIYDVLSNKIYSGIKGLGVKESSIDNIFDQRIVKKPFHNETQIKKAVICYDTPYGSDAYEITKKMSSKLYHEGASLKIVGPISLDVLKTALGKENRPNDYNVATWHSEVRAWDLAAATCILRELNGDIIGEDGKPLTVDILTSPTKKIMFIACGNEELRNKLYSKYKESVNA